MKAVDEPARPAAAVLVVEDEPHMQFVLIENLEFAGYSVVAVSDAESAISEMARRSFDVVIVDVMLPRMSGLEVASQLTQTRDGLRVLLMSGYPNEAALRHGVPAGAALLQKPFNAVALARSVRQVLDGR